MVSSWLDKEMSAASAGVRLTHILRMEACGVPRDAIAQLGMDRSAFGVARICTEGSARYFPDDDGRTAVIVPVIDPDPDLTTTGIVDLIAFRTSRPDKVYHRTGEGIALGLEVLESDAPALLVEHPIEWLSHAGKALLILDWDAGAPFWHRLRRSAGLIVPNSAVKRRITRAVQRHTPLPNLEVRCA